WPEPFGLVMIEALACGTPVVAFRRGSVPEVLVDGATGFVVDDVAGAVAAVGRVAGLDRRACRRAFEERFDAARMARDSGAVSRRRGRGGTDRGRPHAVSPFVNGRGVGPAARLGGILGPIGKPFRGPTAAEN